MHESDEVRDALLGFDEAVSENQGERFDDLVCMGERASSSAPLPAIEGEKVAEQSLATNVERRKPRMCSAHPK
jgi:hypothetical protein